MSRIQQIQASAASLGASLGEPPDQHVKKSLKEKHAENEKVREVVAELNRLMGSSNTKLSFTVDRTLKKTIIKVVDTQTNQVIRQIPSDEALKIAQHIQSLLGILYDASA